MLTADFTLLNDVGLNRQAILDLDTLPAAMLAELRSRFDPEQRYHQLILIGHAGKTLWESVCNSAKASTIRSENPIDDFTISTVERWFAMQFAGHTQQIIYPGPLPVGLQALGTIVGWHHASPFMVGISEEWGTWFAYRAVLLADTHLLPTRPTRPLRSESPCLRCVEKKCLASCPGEALAGGTFALDKCINYRQQPASRCQASCVARVSCPVGAEHRYCDAQMRHTYLNSLKMIALAAA